jgi:hypothetical protein
MNCQLLLNLRCHYTIVLTRSYQTLLERVLHLNLLATVNLYFHVLAVVNSVMLVGVMEVFVLSF